MNNVVLAIVVGIASGLAGGILAGMARGPSGAAPADAPPPVDLTTLASRLDRIEALLQLRTEDASAALRGSGAGDMAEREARGLGDAGAVDALVERLDERMRQAVAESVRSTWEELGDPAAQATEVVAPGKKKVTLAEAAAELELSAREEEEVRRIHGETLERVIALLGKDQEGGEAKVRADFQAAKDDPERSALLAAAYMGRVMTNLGGFIQVGLDHDRKMKEALGTEKAARLESEYDLTDLDPYGFGETFSFGN